MSLIYSPEEDSYLLSLALKSEVAKIIKKNSNIKCLEVGIGSGIQLQTLLEIGVKKENIYGVDLNTDAVKHCSELGFNCMKSDLFSNVNNKYDVILFNPPYLPEDDLKEDYESKLITTGGKEGSEILNKFLTEAKDYLKNDGKIYILISSLTLGIDFSGYKMKIINEKKIFFEKLQTIELTYNKD